MKLEITRLTDTAVLPTRATQGSAGYDLYCDHSASITLQPGERKLISTGIAIALDSADYAALIYARSGLASKHGITLSNCVGVVDSDYRGEIKVPMVNLSDCAYTIEPGERIAQMVITPVVCPQLIEVDTLSQTERGSGGFGSSGKH